MVGTSIIRRQAPSARRLSAATAASDRAWTVEAPEWSLGNPPPSSADALLFRQLFATTRVLLGKLRGAAGNQAHKHPPEETCPRLARRCRCRTYRRSSRRNPLKPPSAAPSSVRKVSGRWGPS